MSAWNRDPEPDGPNYVGWILYLLVLAYIVVIFFLSVTYK